MQTARGRIRRGRVGEAECHRPGKPAIGEVEHNKDDQPDADDAQPKYRQTLQQPYEQSHHLAHAFSGLVKTWL